MIDTDLLIRTLKVQLDKASVDISSLRKEIVRLQHENNQLKYELNRAKYLNSDKPKHL